MKRKLFLTHLCETNHEIDTHLLHRIILLLALKTNGKRR